MVSDNVVLHVLQPAKDLPNWSFVRHCNATIVSHGQMDSQYFATVLQRMTVNLYITISEASPMVPLESISRGVPCLVGPSAILYNRDPILKNALVVGDIDRPGVISAKLKDVISNIGSIKARLPHAVKYMYDRAFQKWKYFMSNLEVRIEDMISSDYQNYHKRFRNVNTPYGKVYPSKLWALLHQYFVFAHMD